MIPNGRNLLGFCLLLVSVASLTGGVITERDPVTGKITMRSVPDEAAPRSVEKKPELASKVWKLNQNTSFGMCIPAEIRIEEVSPEEMPLPLAFTLWGPEKDGIGTVTYQVLVDHVDRSTSWRNLDELDASLKRTGHQGLETSVQRALIPVHLAFQHGIGSYLVITDRALVGKKISNPKQYYHMIMLEGRVGDYVVFVRGYTNSITEQYFTDMNRIIESSEIIIR